MSKNWLHTLQFRGLLTNGGSLGQRLRRDAPIWVRPDGVCVRMNTPLLRSPLNYELVFFIFSGFFRTDYGKQFLRYGCQLANPKRLSYGAQNFLLRVLEDSYRGPKRLNKLITINIIAFNHLSHLETKTVLKNSFLVFAANSKSIMQVCSNFAIKYQHCLYYRI